METRIRNTALQDWKSCRRLFRWRWLQGWTHKGLPAPALLLGQLVHRGLEAFHQGAASPSAILAFAKTFSSTELSPREIENLELSHRHAQAMLAGYAKHYASDPPVLEQKLEQKFSYRIPSSDRISTGTIDRLVRDADGWWLWEHKTTSDGGQGYFDAASFSWQVCNYMFGAKAITGEWPRGIVYNVLQKTALRQGKKETRDEYFARVAAQYIAEPAEMYTRYPILLSKRQLKQYIDQLGYVFDEIASAVATGDKAFYPNTGNCNQIGRRCSFLETCAAYEDSPNSLWFEIKQEEIIHV